MRVYKYRGGDEKIFERDLGSLENDYFWAPNRESLNDPCEGMVHHEELNQDIDRLAQIMGVAPSSSNTTLALKESLADLVNRRDIAGVYSLSKNYVDELLWAHYASNHQGFCIEYDLNLLMSFGKGDYIKFDIQYANHPPKLTLDDMFRLNEREHFIRKIIGHKSKRWQYENEIRIMTSQAGRCDYDFRAVKAIYFGLRMPKERSKKIMERLAGRGIQYFQMCLGDVSYELYHKQVVDPYSEAPKYKYSISPIGNGAVMPELLHERWKSFEGYLHKMTEIVRREPYCKEVIMVEVSLDKSAPGKPVFFGQYQLSEFRYENLYLTPDEIDERYSQILDIEN